ncbi:C-X-C motif chemokine 10 [Cololabis saira]|uniref:C-X-C motif chemokine 10 n=1 Tax=Cololabis saira TaxID=129043 RepID=UPI002AD5095F|nr:C-X-C motif chemokine 10 [Cololabis saira]
MNKSLLLLAALTLCCCISSLDASSRSWCNCMQIISHPIPERRIGKIEVTPPSGRCRRTQVKITMRNGSKVCVNPNAKWLTKLLAALEKKNGDFNSTLPPPASSTASW